MTARVLRRLTLLGGIAWLVVGWYGLDRVVSESDDGWQTGYTVYTVALLLGMLSTVALAAFVSRECGRPRLRMAGLVVSGLGCALAVPAAWALPAWMMLLGVGLALVGAASWNAGGRMLAILAAAQLVAIAVLIGGIEATVGRQDEWGDYPAAGGLALIVLSVLTIAAITRYAWATGRFDALIVPAARRSGSS